MIWPQGIYQVFISGVKRSLRLFQPALSLQDASLRQESASDVARVDARLQLCLEQYKGAGCIP